MKKIIVFFTLIIGIISPLQAKIDAFKARFKQAQSNIKKLAKTEKRTWQALEKLHKDVASLEEQAMNKNYMKPSRSHKCHTKAEEDDTIFIIDSSDRE